MTTRTTVYEIIEYTARIEKNNFIFKSLSDFSYNIGMGCKHGCTFCYVPASAGIKQETNIETKLGGDSNEWIIPHDWIEERYAGKHWGDFHWGDFSLLRSWDEKMFLSSLKKAQKAKDTGKLTPDGHGAIMMCTTTDPYQTLSVPGNPAKTQLLAGQRERLVRRALELILNESDLNVRILTRSPLAVRDFDLYKAFGHRLLFGMSLPTMDDTLSSIYEPNAPGPAVKLRTLERAVAEGINVYVALAPTLPDEGEAEISATIEAILRLRPFTIYHEPINLRADNLARIEAKARELGREINTGVFLTQERWREYAFGQLSLVEKICDDLQVPEGVLHLWPDKDLDNDEGFIRMKKMQAFRDHGVRVFSDEFLGLANEEWENEWKPWLNYWHNPAERISAWPKPSVVQAAPELSGLIPSVVASE